jgi:hypothetical protein
MDNGLRMSQGGEPWAQPLATARISQGNIQWHDILSKPDFDFFLKILKLFLSDLS